jgi:hypothetical protein
MRIRVFAEQYPIDSIVQETVVSSLWLLIKSIS